MNGFEEIDWEVASDYVKRFGGLIIAVLFALVARRKKKASMERSLEREPVQSSRSAEVSAIEPGTDATQLSRRYSQRDQELPDSGSDGDW